MGDALMHMNFAIDYRFDTLGYGFPGFPGAR